jgi:hypothetical protein
MPKLGIKPEDRYLGRWSLAGEIAAVAQIEQAVGVAPP